MFKSLDELTQIHFPQSLLQIVRTTAVRWITGILFAGAGFQAVYSTIFAME